MHLYRGFIVVLSWFYRGQDLVLALSILRLNLFVINSAFATYTLQTIPCYLLPAYSRVYVFYDCVALPYVLQHIFTEKFVYIKYYS